jgi:hypothetical protein
VKDEVKSEETTMIESLESEARRRQSLPSMTVTYMQGFWGAVDYLRSLRSDGVPRSEHA